MSAREFVAAQPHPFLWIASDEEMDSDIEFATGVAPADFDEMDAAGDAEAIERIVAIRKVADNPFADRVMVGRSRNCDIVIRRDSISKLHAVFREVTPSTAMLLDRKSLNGTKVNGEVLTPGTSRPLKSGDEIEFGDVTARFLDAAALYALL